MLKQSQREMRPAAKEWTRGVQIAQDVGLQEAVVKPLRTGFKRERR